MIRVDNITKTFPGAGSPAVDRVTFSVDEGNICVFVGPSGCGKTTILRMINRLIEPDAGDIFVNGENVMKMAPAGLRRTIGYVIQQIGLLPHRTIEANVGLVPGLLKWPRGKTRQRVLEMLEMVGLDPGEVAHKYPHQLSGGQMQRVGVARALAADPPIMLMDEPFGAVDPIVRIRLQDEFLHLQQTFQKTICFVTHDINEAIKMGDYLVILNHGRIVQMGTPINILTNPANDFVSRLLGDDRGVKILDLTRCRSLMAPVKPSSKNPVKNGCVVQAVQPVKIALEMMMKNNADEVGVCSDSQFVGMISWHAIKAHINRVSGGGE